MTSNYIFIKKHFLKQGKRLAIFIDEEEEN
jgi:hypothetical protein